jgi:hypothetical protein
MVAGTSAGWRVSLSVRSSGGNLVTKHGIEKIIRAPKDYDPTLGA